MADTKYKVTETKEEMIARMKSGDTVSVELTKSPICVLLYELLRQSLVEYRFVVTTDADDGDEILAIEWRWHDKNKDH